MYMGVCMHVYMCVLEKSLAVDAQKCTRVCICVPVCVSMCVSECMCADVRP